MEIPDKNRQLLMQKLLDAVKQVSITLFLGLKCFFPYEQSLSDYYYVYKVYSSHNNKFINLLQLCSVKLILVERQFSLQKKTAGLSLNDYLK